MDTHADPPPLDQRTSSVADERLFLWRGLYIWIPGCALLGIAGAWMAVDAQFFFAPLLLFPLLVGLGLGVMLLFFLRLLHVGHLPTLFLGIVVAFATVIFGQHYLQYRFHAEREQHHSKELEQVKAAFPDWAKEKNLFSTPESFGQYMLQQIEQGRTFWNYTARDGLVCAIWALEAMITLGGMFIVLLPALQTGHYCGRCRSWYHTTRSAKLQGNSIVQLARLLQAEAEDEIKTGRCRLQNCRSGCGETYCELLWEDRAENTFFVQKWLDTSLRNQVMNILDEAQAKDEDRGKRN